MLGVQLHEFGQFDPLTMAPMIFRPPGYPIFVAVTLKLWGDWVDPMVFSDQHQWQDQVKAYERRLVLYKQIIYVMQAILLAIGAVTFFLVETDDEPYSRVCLCLHIWN